MARRLHRLGFALWFCCTLAGAQEAQTILHLLDYIGVDYAGAVADGKVKNEDEYKEMQEFAKQVVERVQTLPENPRKAELIGEAGSLAELLRARANPPAVADKSGVLRRKLVEAYKLRLAPRVPPPLQTAGALYAQNCAMCHGAEGRGDGPAAKGLEPAPSNFHDLHRMSQRSVYGLYNTITLGVDGTSMASFKQLPEQDRWALAFFVGNLAVPNARIVEGGRVWESGAERAVFSDLTPIVTLSADEMRQKHGERAAQVQDYLRANPAALRPAPLVFARQKLAEAAEAYDAGDRALAREAAITSYLEGFELVEGPLSNVDAGLMRNIERSMIELRASIEREASPQQVSRQVETVDGLLAVAQEKLAGEGLSPASAFAASLLILLREGLEGILVLAAIIAFVAKSGRRDALPWVHGGWILAVILGAVTWIVASFVIEISGANRELTEGVTALLAAAMLLYVGWWLHGKSYAQAWTRFIKEHVGRALEKRTLWAMAGVSFLAVYREMFEIVLFYKALWVQAGDGGQAAVLGGMAVAGLTLAALGFGIFKYSIRLPMGPFFAAMSALLALMAFVFAGHGVAALQGAGVIRATTLRFDPVPLLGIYPSVEAIAAQLVVAALIAFGLWSARRGAMATA